MLETPHVAVGAAIATKIPNPFISIPLALVSHFVLDRVPHWNPHTYTETMKYGIPTKKTITITMVDILTALATGFYIASLALPDKTKFMVIIAASFASVFPDVTKYPFFLFKNLRKGWYRKWVEYERKLQVSAPFWPGNLTQLITILASVVWLIK